MYPPLNLNHILKSDTIFFLMRSLIVLFCFDSSVEFIASGSVRLYFDTVLF